MTNSGSFSCYILFLITTIITYTDLIEIKWTMSWCWSECFECPGKRRKAFWRRQELKAWRQRRVRPDSFIVNVIVSARCRCPVFCADLTWTIIRQDDRSSAKSQQVIQVPQSQRIEDTTFLPKKRSDRIINNVRLQSYQRVCHHA